LGHAARTQAIGPFHREIAAASPPVFRDIAGDVGELHAHPQGGGMGEEAALPEPEKRTHQHAHGSSDPKAVAHQVSFTQAGCRGEIRLHAREQSLGRLDRQVVLPHKRGQPMAFRRSRFAAGRDQPQVAARPLDKLSRGGR